MYHLSIEPEELKKFSDEEQIEIMREWFHENFENPVEECPFDSREGGYIYVWGGPYYAREELEMEFAEYVDEKLIDTLVKELDSDCTEWSAYSYNQHFDNLEDEYLSQDYKGIETSFERFGNTITTLRQLALIEIDAKNKKTMLYMIYTHAITCLEAFLSEYFSEMIFKNDTYLQNFFQNNLDFKEKKFSLNEIFIKYKDIRKIALSYITDISWHKLEKISKLYRDVLNIEFPKDIGSLYRIVNNRHDIVHRCGKTKDGQDVELTDDDIQEVLDEASRLVEYINNYYEKDIKF